MLKSWKDSASGVGGQLTAQKSQHNYALSPRHKIKKLDVRRCRLSVHAVPVTRDDWDRITDRLVVGSAIPFSVLVLPQVLQNAVNMFSGQACALSIISWEGYLSGLLGNTLMCTHFAGRTERSAVNVQIIGIVNNMLVLFQVALASFMPAPVFLATAGLTALAVAISLNRLKGGLGQDPNSSKEVSQPQRADHYKGGKMPFWSLWELIVGSAGLVAFVQVMSSVLQVGYDKGLFAGITIVLALSAFVRVQMRNSEGRKMVSDIAHNLPGWAATLLFALSPLPQLVRNFLEPSSLVGLSVGTMLLALTGNALMFPRALYTRDIVWMAGSSWACVAGWGQLLSMMLGKSVETGQSYLSLAPFAAVTAMLLSYVCGTLYFQNKFIQVLITT
ncbi:hypothetical protein CEUSTIGMA_g7597.t1 [Chlamydomonas eustigma]|uniref:Uncharacterized protein n=1 Tax=Chlamydomonas eustigma TaxID=1157962 RepID=A0A250XB92_9CHLO|nr:hypothetical protein CEUSTIGMA_g7597.t1 [Chlamydomonas eustigma]|eukprot:GAX80159.1 hypothetical protein CEUSTIGMA_g7597.t1 [Chlamydomonas eustigma]